MIRAFLLILSALLAVVEVRAQTTTTTSTITGAVPHPPRPIDDYAWDGTAQTELVGIRGCAPVDDPDAEEGDEWGATPLPNDVCIFRADHTIPRRLRWLDGCGHTRRVQSVMLPPRYVDPADCPGVPTTLVNNSGTTEPMVVQMAHELTVKIPEPRGYNDLIDEAYGTILDSRDKPTTIPYCNWRLAMDGQNCVRALYRFTCAMACPQCDDAFSDLFLAACPEICEDVLNSCPRVLSRDPNIPSMPPCLNPRLYSHCVDDPRCQWADVRASSLPKCIGNNTASCTYSPECPEQS